MPQSSPPCEKVLSLVPPKTLYSASRSALVKHVLPAAVKEYSFIGIISACIVYFFSLQSSASITFNDPHDSPSWSAFIIIVPWAEFNLVSFWQIVVNLELLCRIASISAEVFHLSSVKNDGVSIHSQCTLIASFSLNKDLTRLKTTLIFVQIKISLKFIGWKTSMILWNQIIIISIDRIRFKMFHHIPKFRHYF